MSASCSAISGVKVERRRHSGKGSHTVWSHSLLAETITIAGKDGDDAKPYLEKEIQKRLKQLEELEE